MAPTKKESMLHFWTTFVLRVIFIAASILLVLWFCSITVARIFGGRSWKKKAIIGAVGAMGTTANFAKAHPVLFKRARWTFAAGSTLAGLVLAAGSVGIPSWTAAICLAFSGPVCVPVAGSILAAVDIAIAAAIVWKTEGFEMHKKRSTTAKLISIFGHDITALSHHLTGTTHISSSTGEVISFGLVGEISQVNPLQKRDSAVNHNFIQFNTTLGVHVAVSPVLSIEELAKHILVAEPGVPFGNSSLVKRQEFSVNWVSYGWDNANHDLSQEWYNYEGGSFDSLLEDAVQDALGKYPDWKYCVAPNDLKRGEATNYQDIPGVGTGTGNAMHGEVYFNTYGGIDGYCNDNEDGAQDSSGR